MSYHMKLEGFDKELLSDIAAEFETLLAGREQMNAREFLDVRNYCKARTDLKKPDDKLNESQKIWKEFYLFSDDNLSGMIDTDQKINLEKLEQQMEELELLSDKLNLLHPLGREIEKMLIKQRMYLVVHMDKDEPTQFKVRKDDLEDKLYDEAIPQDSKLDIANQIIKLVDVYRESFLRDLQALNNEIQKKVAIFETEINNVPKQTEHEMELMRLDFKEWIRLAKEQHLGRIMATNSVMNQVDLDKLLPQSVIDSGGDTTKTLSKEETQDFARQMVTYKAMLDQANKTEEEISVKKDPITKRLLGNDIEDELAQEYAGQSPTPQTPVAQLENSLENNVGYRIAKVVYIILWIVGVAVVLILGLASESVVYFAVGFLILWGLLALIKKGFIYIIGGK